MKSYFEGFAGSNRAIVSLVAICVLLGGLTLMPSTTHADTYVAYTITDAQFQNGTLSGTFDLDVTTRTASNIDLVLTEGSSSFTYVANAATIFDNGSIYYFEVDLVPGNNSNIAGIGWLMSVNLSAPPQMINLSTDTNVSGMGIMGFDGSNRDFLTGGTAVDPGPNSGPTGVPEPSTLLLLASGLMPIGFFSRRWMARHPK